ncbi:aldo/keto reductase [Vibrio natriegens]|uniref:aldo/keto reductase n=1 Tax=Vibrio natriegens TaxID=691 RepID=UPI0035578F00
MTHNIFNQKIALGAWAWGSGFRGGDQIFGNSFTEQDLKPVFEQATEKGLTLWDTAAVYGMGTSETILGSFIKEQQREKLIISTKFTPQIASNSEHPAQAMLNESKQRLHTDYVDIYWIHNNADVEKWTPELISLAKSGQIKHIGVSNHNLEEIKLANSILAKEGLKISAVQNHYSLMHRASEESGVLDYCKENGIVFFAYMVLEQGALSGKYNSQNLFPEGSARAASYNAHLPKIEELTKVLEEIANNYDASVAQIATAWAIAKGTLPIIGVTKVGQVDDAAHAAQIELAESEIAKIEETAKQLGISTIREWESQMA